MMKFIVVCVLLAGFTAADEGSNREPRHLKQKLCGLLGLCGGGGFGGGYGGYNQGYNPGYNQGYPAPINIGISQSQSSSSGGGGFYGGNYPSYPNNYQYNGNFGNPGYPNYPRPYPGGYNNGYGSTNNQFNGNYYGGPGNFGGPGNYGGRPAFFDDAGYQIKPIHEDLDENYGRTANKV